MIGEGITLSGEGTINGHIALAGENVTLKGLTINATSIGTDGPQKTVILGACDKVTIQDCKLNGIVPEADKSKYVANGIDLTTKSASASYTITGNTITGCNGLVDNWTAINVIIQDAKSSKIDNAAIALENTYDEKSFGYVRMTANDAWSYAYIKGADNHKAANAFYCMKTNGGTIIAPDATCDGILKELNGEPFALTGSVSATCKDGYMTTNSADASKMLAEGKAVKLLTYNAEGVEGAKFAFSEINVAPLITNLPDSVAFASTPVKLAFNTKNVVVTVTEGSDLVSLSDDGVLSFLNPGEVVLTLTVKNGQNGKEAELTNTQKLKITKRALTLTAGIVPNYTGKQGDTAIVYDANTDITLKWADNIAVSGLPWEAVASGYFKTDLPTGKRANKNVGDKVPVEITNEDLNALLNADSAKRYTLAPITFVTAKVVKAKATVTAQNVTDYTFGSDLPTFEATTTGLLGTPADVLDGTLKFICSATPDSLVKEGGYDIMPYGLTSDNYAITFEKGTLTVKATNPKIEIVDAKVTGNAEAKTITVRAKLVHAGGLETATVTAKDVESGVTPASEGAITPDVNGIYKFEVSDAAAKKHTITFTATTTEQSNNTGTASIDVTVEAGTPQNLKFDDKVLSSIVYGDSLALVVSSDQAAAKGDYTFNVTSGKATISNTNVLKPTAAGDVVVTVSRAADENYSFATVMKTIKVTPRPLKAEVAAFAPKTYDGNVTATVPDITLSADYKVIGSDAVSIATNNVSATYASKNVGTHAISLSALTLTGAQAANYTLIQPTGLKGEITKKDATVKVDDVTRMYNQRYTKYSFTPDGLIEGESLSSVYTGKLDVTENEKEGTLTLKIDGNLCRNYNLTAQNGTLTITKGTPVVVAYKVVDQPKYLVVDSAGHQNLTVSETLVNGYFQVTGDDGSVTNSVNAIPTSSLKVTNALLGTKAGDDWAGWNSEEATVIEYAASTATITNVDDYTYSSTDLNRLSIEGTNLTANGVGKVAIIVTSTSGDVKVKLYDVTPKKVTYTANMSKTYDGLTLATGSVTLADVNSNDNVVLDMEGVTFNYATPAAGEETINPSQAPILTGADANNYNLVSAVTGKIAKKAITVSEPISAYYTGQTNMALDEFTSEGILSNDIVSLNVTLDNAEVGPRKFTLNSLAGDNAANYTLSATTALDGTILKPTIVVTVPETASSPTDAKNKLTYTIRETGKPVSGSVFSNAVQVVSLGNNAYQVSTKKDFDNKNFTLLYTKNLIGFKAETNPGGGGSTTVSVSSVSLDKTELTLPRLDSYTLVATVGPSDASDKSVTWKSSDESIATVDANGKVTAVKVGKATITVTTVDGGKTATCEVTVDFATGLEEAIANTVVYGRNKHIHIQPVAPVRVAVVNLTGVVVYQATISSTAQIPVNPGIYLVKLGTGSEAVVTKISVR
ncbi:YDG domain-containing protein [uncultured Parabacteroides sp.]|uniref:YDG domain-containing protein n=1 Tax=uncultured Parabacteroides sp. TaxID=512312 RepID=UPI002804DC7B|nr:Ig-like domain-containing protein [uncultured Parabacteroides sp.]